MRQRLERKISFVCLFVYFCHPHFWFYSFRIFPSASAIRRYPVHVLQTPLCTLWFASVWQMLWMRLCAESVLSKSVWSIYFAFSRVYYLHSSRYSVWGFDLRMFDDSLYSVRRFDLRLCASFVLSGSVWPINFPFPRVYDLGWLDLVLVLCVEIWFASVWRVFVLCDLRLCDKYNEYFIGHHVRVPCAW